MLVVRKEKSFGVISELDLLQLHGFAVRPPQDRKENFRRGSPLGGDRAPVDVEVVEKPRLRSVLENAHPPRVLRAGRHVIRNDVEKKAELVLLQILVQR